MHEGKKREGLSISSNQTGFNVVHGYINITNNLLDQMILYPCQIVICGLHADYMCVMGISFHGLFNKPRLRVHAASLCLYGQ